jgi:DNA invertase Pin-like site-specific DNA recombinase
MEDRFRQLGWDEIEVIQDLGCSAAGTVTRTGFERMLAEVCLGKVGAVAAREVSRFARNSRESQRLDESGSDESDGGDNDYSPPGTLG